MNSKLTLLLTAAVVSAGPAFQASALEQKPNLIVAQQAQPNENAQERRERREQRQDQKQDQRQERRQQTPDNAQGNTPANNAPGNRPANNQAQQNNEKRNDRTRDDKSQQRPAVNTQERNTTPQTTPPATTPKANQPVTQQNTNAPNKPATNTQTPPPAGQNNRQGAPNNRQAAPPAAQQNKETAPKTATEPAAKPAETPAARDNGPKRLDAVKAERRETKEGNRTIIKESNRTIIKENNTTIIRHDDTDRFRRAGGTVQVQRRGNNTETVIVRPGGVRIVETVDERGRLLRRSRFVNGREIVLINNRYNRPGFSFIVTLPPPVIRIPRERYIVEYRQAPRPWIYETLIAAPVEPIERRFTLDEIRYNVVVRERMPRIDIDTINFETGSWDVTPEQAQLLEPIAAAMAQAIEKNPGEIYLIEGHTDSVGTTEDNLSLSDRRAEAVAEVLSTQFKIPPENLVTQGYGEQNLKVNTQGPEPRNRYVTVRRITPLMAQQ